MTLKGVTRPKMIYIWILIVSAVMEVRSAVEDRSTAFVRIHHERSTDSELFASIDAFGDTHDLTLTKFEVSPVEVVQIVERSNGTSVVNVTEKVGDRKYFFVDSRKGALLYMNSDNTLEGALSRSLGLRYEKDRHIASKIHRKHLKYCASRTIDDLRNSSTEVPEIATRQTPSYIVEVHVMADSTFYSKFSSMSDMVNYLRVYWYLVNRRFKTVSCAKIDLRLIKISTSNSSSIDSEFMDVASSTTSDVDKSLDKLTTYFADSTRGPFDMAHLMSARDFYRVSGDTKYYSNAGIAYVRGVCKISSGKAYNTGLSEDTGYYEGVLTTAHEVGHNLGASHDGQGTSCPESDGYLMSNVANSYKEFWFSSCSSTAICDGCKLQGASCLKTQTSSDNYPFPSNLADSNYSLDEQCRYHHERSYAYADTSIPASQHCYRLKCKYVEGKYTYTATSGYPAIEGTQCYPAANGLKCIDGSCQ